MSSGHFLSFSDLPVSAAGTVRRRAAFTLMELTVTMAIGLLLIIFLFQLFNATVHAWRNGENQTDTYREARAAMQLMVRDISQTTAPMLQSAFVTPAPGATAFTGNTAPVLVIDRYPVPDPPLQSGDEINEELYCLTNIPNNGASSLCAVGYFCMWMPDLIPDSDPQALQKKDSAPRAYALVRQFLGSGRPATNSATASATPIPGLFDRFQAAAASGHAVLSFADLYTRARPPTAPNPAPVPPVSVGSQLASFIWDLQFRTTSSLQTPPATTPYPATTPPPAYQKVLPAFVEIRFKALSAGAARQLEGYKSVSRTDWNDASTNPTLYQKIILPGSRQFVARVPLYGGSASSP